MDDLRYALEQIAKAVLRGDVDAKPANCATLCVSAAIRTFTASEEIASSEAKRAKELSDEQLDELIRRLAQREGQGADA